MPRTSASEGVSRRTVLRTTALGALATAAGVPTWTTSSGRRARLRRTSSSSWPTIWATPTSRATAGPISGRRTSTASRRRGVRFLQAYANSAVCSATRTALITGRYQYRLRVGLEEPLGRQQRRRPAAGASDAAVAAEEGAATARRSSASGTWARCRSSARSRAATTISTASAAAASTTTAHAGADPNDDLWDDDVPVHQMGYLTDLLGEPRGRRRQRLREVAPAVPAEPAFQRAALAVGSAGRRGGVRALRARRTRPRATTTAARRRPIRR